MSTTWQQLNTQVLVGTYTRDRASEGIYLVDTTGEVRLITEADNPSFLLAHPQAEVIYCVNETDDYRESDDKLLSSTGAVSAFLKADLGREGFFLDLINQQPSLGADPCHICINHDGRFLAVSNYSGGSFTTFGLEQDGYIESFQSLTTHTGSGPAADRQACAHVHSAMLVGEHLFIADLGADRVSRYQVSNIGEVVGTQTHITAKSGAGPRFMANNDTSLFGLNELDNTLSSYDLATLSLSQTIHTLKDSSAVSIAAHLTITRDKRFLYLSNRGEDSIAVVQIEPELRLVQTISTAGEHPRHFTLTPDEQFLIVANQDTDNLVIFNRDSVSGQLSSADIEISVPCPTCVLIV